MMQHFNHDKLTPYHVQKDAHGTRDSLELGLCSPRIGRPRVRGELAPATVTLRISTALTNVWAD